jgi:Asp-tRNA(Asn)/Glu-tRNA(Gln) amidotransferase A subunit family amidase
MCGEDPRDPFSLPRTGESYLAAARSPWKPKRVAYSADLGITKTDKEVAAITAKAAGRFKELGATVEEAHPDFTGLHECFITLRVYDFFMKKAALLRDHRDLLKPEDGISKRFKIDLNDGAPKTSASRWRNAIWRSSIIPLPTPATVVAAYPIENCHVAEATATSSPTTSTVAIACDHRVMRHRAAAVALPEKLPSLQIASPRSEARILPPRSRWKIFWDARRDAGSIRASPTDQLSHSMMAAWMQLSGSPACAA